MYEKKLAEYYDILFSNKNYKEECSFIINQSKNHGRLLDIGCGTLNHSLILSDVFSTVVGIDLSEEMLDVARQKNNKKNISLLNYSLDKCNFENKFDCIISMFNVINHIHDLKTLQEFFSSISSNLDEDGTFIFDCWNSIACVLDKPKAVSQKQVKNIYHTLISKTETETDLFNSISTMKTTVEIFDDVSMIDSFVYNLEQRLWTPNLLNQLLISNGFNHVLVVPYFDASKKAAENDYRITFICKKNA